jgi:hypothetical protein
MAQEKLHDDRGEVGHEYVEGCWNRQRKEGFFSKETQESDEHVGVHGHGAQCVEKDHGADTDLVR